MAWWKIFMNIEEQHKKPIEARKIEWSILTEAQKLLKMFWLFAPQWKKVDFCFSFLETKSFGRIFFCDDTSMTTFWKLSEQSWKGGKSFVLDWKAGIRIENLGESRKKLRLKIFRRRFDAFVLIILKLQMDFSGTKKFLAG